MLIQCLLLTSNVWQYFLCKIFLLGLTLLVSWIVSSPIACASEIGIGRSDWYLLIHKLCVTFTFPQVVFGIEQMSSSYELFHILTTILVVGF